MSIKIKPLLFFVLGTLAVGALAGVISMGSMEEYASLNKPALSPPAWLFPLVWSILYILMGISAYLVYVRNDKNSTNALIFYALQLAVNFLWPIAFFNFGAYLFAFIWLILLLVLVIIMTVKFYSVVPIAAYLQIPYIVWLLFAGYLNLSIYLLNR